MNEMNIIRVPRALKGLEPLTVDMTDLRQAEIRLAEVAFTNSARAPELLATFNRSWLTASRYLNLLEYEHDVAARQLSEIRATIIIDKLPTLLAEKGLVTARSPLGSEDVRQAFLDRDPDYKGMQDLIIVLKSYINLFETLKKGFENGYNSVKRLIGGDPTGGYRPNPHLPQSPPSISDAPSLDIDNLKVTSSTVNDDFFGNPK